MFVNFAETHHLYFDLIWLKMTKCLFWFEKYEKQWNTQIGKKTYQKWVALTSFATSYVLEQVEIIRMLQVVWTWVNLTPFRTLTWKCLTLLEQAPLSAEKVGGHLFLQTQEWPTPLGVTFLSWLLPGFIAFLPVLSKQRPQTFYNWREVAHRGGSRSGITTMQLKWLHIFHIFHPFLNA